MCVFQWMDCNWMGVEQDVEFTYDDPLNDNEDSPKNTPCFPECLSTALIN